MIEVDDEPLCHIDLDLTVIVCYQDGYSIYIKRYNTEFATEDTPEVVLSGVGSGRCVAFSPCGRHLAVGYDDGNIVICNLDAGEAMDGDVDGTSLSQDDMSQNESECDESDDVEETRCGLLPWKCFCMGRYFSGRMLSSNSRSEISGAYDFVRSQYKLEILRNGRSGVSSLALSRDGKRVISGSSDGSVRAWEQDGEEWVSALLNRHEHEMTSVAISNDGKRIVSGSRDKSVRVWEQDGEEWVSALRTGHEDIVTSVAISRNGEHMISGSRDKSVRVWEKDRDGWVSAKLAGQEHEVTSVGMSGDGNPVVSRSENESVRVWEKDGEQWVSALLNGQKHEVTSVGRSGDSNRGCFTLPRQEGAI